MHPTNRSRLNLKFRYLLNSDTETQVHYASGNGYIPTSCLREILRELDDQLTSDELDMMIEEIDSDGSGTVDFDGKYSK
jgi:hypothetical protein